MYTLADAARLTGAAPAQLNRWLFGYHFTKTLDGDRRRIWSPPLWDTELSGEDLNEKVIGFHDLLEVRFVDAFVRCGVPLPVVRRCLDHAQQLYGVKYPFTTLRFKTDGRTIFGEAVRQAENDGSLLDLRSRQNVFREIITPSLYAGIEYNQDQATKWYPTLRRERVVLDPSRRFGSPILEDSGMPTATVYASFLAEGENEHAVGQTAKIYRIEPRYVRSAVRFEKNLRRGLH